MAEPSPWRRRALRGLAVVAGLITLLSLGVLIDAWDAMGYAPSGARLARMEASPQWDDGGFENPEPLWNDTWGMLTGALDRSDYTAPERTPPFERVAASRFDAPPESGLRITWLGHSTLLIEIDGRRFLTDPVWGERTSPLTWVGPSRWYPAPLSLDDLPELDAILISHDHYDHLDHPTIVALADDDTPFVCPLGVGAHLEGWGIDAERIIEVDWWDRHTFGDVELVVVPARHASGRQVFDQNRTLWAGYALLGASHRALFSGDTGLFRGMTEIGERLGPFDVTMLEVGAYGKAWPDWHLGPEQAIRAHGMLRGEVLVPIHWGLFDLANHGWTAPIERTLVAAEAADVTVVTPRPGESFEPGSPPPVDRWWPEVPWLTAEQDPIVATDVD